MRVRQVLMALMETSIQATTEGSIRLYVSVNDAASPVTVRFDITDTSPGMTPDQQAALFQPSADTSRSDGGLGLPIAQRLAEAMGGEVSCDSAVGQGALYWFTFKALVDEKEITKSAGPSASAEMLELDALDVVEAEGPDTSTLEVGSLETGISGANGFEAERAIVETLATAALPPMPQPEPEPEPQPVQDSTPEPVPARTAQRANEADRKREPAGSLAGHVLMIEDNSVNRLLIGAYLDEFGLTFDVAETGAAALMCLAQRSYDLVLMDTVLPDYRGLQLAQRIRSQESVSARVPIVALATLSDTEDEKTYVDAGVNASVDKPIQGLELYAALVPLVPAKKEAAEDEDWTPVY
jgi:CheY-like chemotaxis protein